MEDFVASYALLIEINIDVGQGEMTNRWSNKAKCDRKVKKSTFSISASTGAFFFCASSSGSPMKRIPFNYGLEDKITTETNAPFFLCSTFYFPWFFFFFFDSRANNLDMCIVWKCHPNGTRYIRESMDWNSLQSDLERSNVVLLWLLFENFRAKISNFQHKISIQSTHEIHITRFSVRSNSIEFVLPDSKTVNCILVIDFRLELLFSQKTHKNSFWTKMQKRKKTISTWNYYIKYVLSARNHMWTGLSFAIVRCKNVQMTM